MPKAYEWLKFRFSQSDCRAHIHNYSFFPTILLYFYLFIFLKFYLFIYLFIFGCVGSSFLCEGFLYLWQAGATLHRGARASHFHGPSLLRSTGSRCAGSVVVAHGPSCSAARGILPDQGSNPCSLHWQADSQPLCHQGSPILLLENTPLNLESSGLFCDK